MSTEDSDVTSPGGDRERPRWNPMYQDPVIWLDTYWEQCCDTLYKGCTEDEAGLFIEMAFAYVNLVVQQLVDSDDPALAVALQRLLGPAEWKKCLEQTGDRREQADLRAEFLQVYVQAQRNQEHSMAIAAIDYQLIGELVVGRARTVQNRLRELETLIQVHPNEIPERFRAYLEEVTRAYLLGLDVACITLARATLEQLMKELLVQRPSDYTDARLRREQPGATTLLKIWMREGLVGPSHDAAERLIKRADSVLHRHLPEERISDTLATDSMRDLHAAMRELLQMNDPLIETD